MRTLLEKMFVEFRQDFVGKFEKITVCLVIFEKHSNF